MIYEDYPYNDDYNNDIQNADLLTDDYNVNYNDCYGDKNHVHEYTGSTKLAEQGTDRHNHRLAGVTGEAIPIRGGRNHVHKIKNDNTDSVDHYHKVCVTTGPAIRIPGTNKHVHLICGRTGEEDNHCHKFLFTSLIEEPLV